MSPRSMAMPTSAKMTLFDADFTLAGRAPQIAEPSDEGCDSVLHTTWREQLPQILIAVVAAVTVFYLLRRMLTASSAEPGVDPDD